MTDTNRTTNIDELYRVRREVILGAILYGAAFGLFVLVYVLEQTLFPDRMFGTWFAACIAALSFIFGTPTRKTFSWLLRYKRLAWVIQETEPLAIIVLRRKWLILSWLEFQMDSETSARSVYGRDPELGRLLTLPRMYPIKFSPAQRKLFESGPVNAEVFIDPESYSAAAVRTSEGFIFPDSIKRAWHQPQ